VGNPGIGRDQPARACTTALTHRGLSKQSDLGPIWDINEERTTRTLREGAAKLNFPTYPIFRSLRPRESFACTPRVVTLEIPAFTSPKANRL
jgi:hypothetical protein